MGWNGQTGAGRPMSERRRFTVRFWGVRGTVPCPGPTTLRYGGNTPCLEILCGEDRLIFDGGTGLKWLGKTMLAEGRPTHSHLFFTHTHMDHVGGLPFFKPAYDARNELRLWSGHLKQQRRHLKEVLCALMQPPLFPVPIDILHACIGFNDFDAGDALEPLPGVTIKTAALNHPGGATGYRVEFDGRAVCYVTDTEHHEGERDPVVLDLIQNSDLVIYDTTYTDKEYPRFHGWGHSTWQEGLRLCEEANAARLVAFHHDPEHDDDAMDRIAAAMEAARPGSLVAREGQAIEV